MHFYSVPLARNGILSFCECRVRRTNYSSTANSVADAGDAIDFYLSKGTTISGVINKKKLKH